MFSKLRLLSSLILACGVVFAQQPSGYSTGGGHSSGTFTNGGFETGDFSGWLQGGGTWDTSGWSNPGDPATSDYVPGKGVDPALYLPGGARYNPRFAPGGSSYASSVTCSPQNTDSNSGHSLIVVYSGNCSAVINDQKNDLSVSVVSQTVSSYSAPHIYFSWAAALESSHTLTDSDYFSIKLTDDTTGETLFQVAYNSKEASTANLFHSATGARGDTWFYTQWQVEDLDVSARQGHTFTLILLASDCPYTGHAGYAYLDSFGSVAPPPNPGIPTPPVLAPPPVTPLGTPLTLTSTDLGTVAQGSTIFGNVSASGGQPPYTYTTVGALPAGITASGSSIGGTAGAPGNYNVTIVVSDSAGSSAAGNITYAVFGLTSTTLPDIIQFSPYLNSIGIAGGTPPYTFTASGLPQGIQISSAGVLQGTARTTGNFSVPVTITDGSGLSFSTTLQLRVVAPLPLQITSAKLPDGTIGSPYSNSLTASGGAPPYTWSIISGSLPAGLTFHTSGSITGQPSAAGSSSLVVRVTDITGASVTGGVTLTVNPTPLTILNPSPFANGTATVPYPSVMFVASGGTASYTFSASGSLPPGLSLSSAGVLSGIPTTPGSYSFNVTVTDSNGKTAVAQPSLTINPYALSLALSAGSLTFNGTAGSSMRPASQVIGVQSTNPATPLHFSVTPSSGANWLTVNSGSTTPSNITVSLNDAALALPGGVTPYTATLTVSCVPASACTNNPQTVQIALNQMIQAPALSVSSDLLSFSSDAASLGGSSQQIALTNIGGGAVGIASVSCGAAWCSVSGTPGYINAGVTAPLTVSVSATGLNPGFYRSTVDIHASTGAYSVPVTLFVANSAVISVQPSGTQFSSSVGGVPASGPNSNMFYVEASGSAPISWTASVLPGASWLQVNTASGSSSSTNPGTVTFNINGAAAAGLAAGAYYGRIEVTPSNGASAQDFEVVLNVAPANMPQNPRPAPQGVLFISGASTPPPPQRIQIATSSAVAQTFSASASTNDGGSWLSIDTPSGTASPGSPASTLVSVNPTGLAAGVYYGGISYQFNGANVPTVNVTMVVTPVGGGNNGTSVTTRLAEPKAAGNCTPKLMVPAQIGLVNNFSAPTAWPTPLTLQVVSDCGSAVTNAQVVATFSNGDAPIALTLANPDMGIYSATWTPRHTGSEVTVAARATAPGLPTATTTLSGTVTPNNAPLLTPHSTLHVFDPLVGAGLGPGTIIQMYGQFLAPSTTLAPSVPLATSLAGTSVLIGGIPAPLYFVSAGQINAQVPFELKPGQPYQVIVNANGALTTPDTVQLTPVSPGLAALPDGTVIAQHGDGSLVTEKAPAKPGEFLVIYTAGMGMTDNPVTTGGASPSSPLARPQDTPTLTIGGQPAAIAFAGLTPGLVGLYQVNFQVPAGAPNGDLPLVISQTNADSNSTILPVHQ